MRVFELGVADSAARLIVPDPIIAEQVSTLLMSSPLNSGQWTAPVAKADPTSRGVLKDVTSILAHSAYPVFSDAVQQEMISTMGITHDWLPLAGDVPDYSVLNLKNEIDAN